MREQSKPPKLPSRTAPDLRELIKPYTALDRTLADIPAALRDAREASRVCSPGPEASGPPRATRGVRTPSPAEWAMAVEGSNGLALAIAFHEAAHAVAFVVEGAGIDSLTIEWRRDGRNVVITGGRCRARRADRVTARACAAGIAVERAMGRGDVRDQRYWAHDERAIRQKLMKEPGYTPGATELRTHQEASALVHLHGLAVRALAHELVERVEIPGAEAERIIYVNLAGGRATPRQRAVGRDGDAELPRTGPLIDTLMDRADLHEARG